jgi:hypothetical protein
MENSLSIKPLSAHRFRPEFPNVHSRSHLRKNLTALSHRYNLYFVAQRDVILVSSTWYPEFHLQEHVEILVPVQGTGDGHIDVQYPHQINHLVVEQLGTQEVLIVACDDGTIAIWHTFPISIWDTSKRYDRPPVVLEDLEESAWGIAVHRKSRKIAFTSNSYTVHVLEMALEDNEDTNKSCSMHKSRQENMMRYFKATEYNLPCVAFCNTGDDPLGRYVMCGDITGKMMIWDTFHDKIVRFWTAHHCCRKRARNYCQCFAPDRDEQYDYCVWGLGWLSLRSFIEYHNSDEYLDKQDVNLFHFAGNWKKWRSWGYVEERSKRRQLERPPMQVEADFSIEHRLLSDENGFVTENEVGFLEDMGVETAKVKTDDCAIPPAGPRLYISQHSLGLDLSEYPTVRNYLDAPRQKPVPGATINSFSLPYWFEQERQDELVANSHYRFTLQNRFLHFAVIEELGLVLVSTGSGRCVVLNLISSSDGFQMTVEDVLPTKKQEERKERPDIRNTFLLGMTVAPIIGSRSWVLFLHYTDHKMLTYELNRKLPV